MTGSAWDEMLGEFRALGGTADNIRMGEGALGRGIFPIDPARPVAIRIPETLLIDTSDVVFENGMFRVAGGASVGARERSFLENYESRFSWGGGGRKETEQLFAQAQALPAELRHELRTEHRCGSWFDEPADTLVQEQFIGSRCIAYKDRTVVMPVIELVNHGAGSNYDSSSWLSLNGTFAGEVLVKYSDTDPYGMFLTWGFAYEQPQAMSIGLSGAIGQTRLRVERDFGAFKPDERVWVPKLASAAGGATLDFLMIGNKQYPRLCKGIFYKLMREAGLAGFEEAFDTIQHVNRMHFLGLLAAIENIDGAMARTLRRMARFQLQTMSFSYGVRAI